MSDGAERGVELGQLLARARETLQAAGIEEAALEARTIVEHFTGTGRIDAISNPSRAVDAEQTEAVLAALERRRFGEPVHRIIGYREFHGLPLRLSADTLEPRPDTEALVELVLPFVRDVATLRGQCRILDLGAGTGAIALALLHREPMAIAVGSDISLGALAMAAANADMLRIGGRYRTVQSNWFDNIDERFDLIASNPPYIPSSELNGLQREVRDYDPRLALDGGQDGLDAYRVIATDAADHLEGDGRVAVEIGHNQKRDVTEIFSEAGLRLTGAARDLAGHDRALLFEL
jgi:release factor glutamine methyltransferase